ncbi:MAG: 50S ribosomal protein L32 [Francisellaceae bacterium]|nr:50S ribosomal protein L32 [Francisellaceae bacterium]MBT6208382.1 50S ribosomal protein L32 [Francisellaceae bacterium]MBT6538175.1 50S ribosomal protein L32 [Francisellaceae bacterium]
MAVQQNRTTRSKRNFRRAHDSISGVSLTVDSGTGETHRRHHISLDGFYRGKEVLKRKEEFSDSDDE